MSSDDPHDLLAAAEQAARAGAAELLQWQGRVHPREKGPRDLVSEADLASQEVIHKLLRERFPEHHFLGEEDVGSQSPNRIFQSDDHQPTWVVDPLDGTVNYIHGLPGFAVSIGLVHHGRSIAGVVYDPLLDEMFAAAEDRPATCNGQPMGVSGCTTIEKALLAASLPSSIRFGSPQLQRFAWLATRCRALRRLGSAALNMVYVAMGRLDGYWATSVNCWDVAAGAIIAERAGAVLTDLQGAAFQLADPKFILAATPQLHHQFRHALEEELPIG